jgi:hypothetical protein
MVESKTNHLNHGLAIVMIAIPAFLVATTATQALAAKPGFGMLYNDGEIMRTLVPPAAFPNEGQDPIYEVTNGVADQLGIASVAPGDSGYHGGAWAVYLVTFSSGVTPYLLTSEDDVEDAEDAGDLTVTRAADMDFRCPVQPN